MYRLAIFIYAKECDIQVVARELEIIRIAAKKGHLKFRSKNQPHIGVLFETIKVIESAGVERDYVAADAGSGGTIFFDAGHRRFANFGSGGVVHAGMDGGVDFVRDVGDLLDDIQFQAGAAQLVFGARSIEGGAEKVVAGMRESLQAILRQMVIGDGQAIGGDEGARSAIIEAHRSQANMIEPLGSEGESILGLDLRHRRGIEQPIAFVGNTGRGQRNKQEKTEKIATHQEGKTKVLRLEFPALMTTRWSPPSLRMTASFCSMESLHFSEGATYQYKSKTFVEAAGFAV